MNRLCAVWLAVLLAACQQAEQDDRRPSTEAPPEPEPTPLALCEGEVSPISEVQGAGFTSPLVGQAATVRGIVTLTAATGLFIQEAQPATLERVSHGIFIASPELAHSASKGHMVAVRGTVEELGERDDTLTSIVAILSYENCGVGPEPPIFDARLPLTDEERESYEAMHVLLEQPLTVTEVRDVDEGETMLSALGILRAPTEVALPGAEALAQERKNREWSMPVRNESLRDLDPYTKIQAGAVVNVLRGVVAHDGWRLGLITEGDFEFVPRPPPKVPARADGAIRVVSLNLYEYFNGDGRGGGFPAERGAETPREFRRQSDRLVESIEEMRPDVLAVMEVENDGFGPHSAIRDLARAVSTALGAEFEVAEPQADKVGTDAIAVGLLFRTDRVAAHGAARVLEGGSFGPQNRVPIAQVLSDRAVGERFLVVVNHLKSKGYCPESGPDTAQGDGQACWNPTRVEGAGETLRWARQLAAEAGTDRLLLVGDFNAYRQEDPIRALLDGGLVELVARHNPGIPLYTYIYRGAAGTLDYAFASESLAEHSAGAFIWHINAAYPWSARPSEPWLRSSDHDPVVVDLRFSQPFTSH